MSPQPLQKGDIVQINPSYHETLGACLMVVTDPKPWGAMGYVTVPQQGGAGRAYIRVPTEAFVRVGQVIWLPEDEAAEVNGQVGHA